MRCLISASIIIIIFTQGAVDFVATPATKSPPQYCKGMRAPTAWAIHSLLNLTATFPTFQTYPRVPIISAERATSQTDIPRNPYLLTVFKFIFLGVQLLNLY